MRYPIRRQLLLPVLGVVGGAILLTSGLAAWLDAGRARQREVDALRRVVGTLTVGGFPLNTNVLRRMEGLSGAHFAVLDGEGRLQATSLAVGEAAANRLAQLQISPALTRSTLAQPIRLAGSDYLAARVPVVAESSAPQSTTLVVLYPEQQSTLVRRDAVLPALEAGAGVAVLALVVVSALARRLVRPIVQLQGQTAAIAGGDFRPLEPSPRDDELRDLGLAINTMANRLAGYAAEVRDNERSRVLNLLASGLAHQVRNLAAGCQLAVQLHARDCRDDADGSLSIALRQLATVEKQLRRFLTLGLPRQMISQPVSLSAVVRDSLELLRPLSEHTGIAVHFDAPEGDTKVDGDADLLEQLLLNLITNAIEAAGEHRATDACVTVEVDRDATDVVRLHVSDTGIGPSPDIVDQLFQPFVSKKRGGTGLGLAVARQIAEDHGGALSWRRDARTTRFTLALPMR